MSVQLFTKITGSVSEYFSFTEETTLDLKLGLCDNLDKSIIEIISSLL